MKEYDVIVCGGGCAGFCAAVAASRLGAKTALVERYNSPGGILTVLGNGSIVQFNNPYIEDKKMIITGIAWEFVLRLHRADYGEDARKLNVWAVLCGESIGKKLKEYVKSLQKETILRL